MTENQEIGTWGAVSLIVTLITTKILISAPSFYAEQSLSAGWLEVLISGMFELFILAIMLRLTEGYKNMDIIDIAGESFGKAGRYTAGISSIIVFVISSAAVFRCFCELIRNTVIRGMSYEDISFFILAVSVVGAFLGIRILISASGLMLPCIVIAVILILLINIPRYSFSNILPLLGPGVRELTGNALMKNASFFEIGIFLFFLPYFKDKKDVKNFCFTGMIFSVLLSSIITLAYQLAVPYEVAGTFALPLYQMTRMIKAGTFFQRIEPLNVFIWGGAMYTYISTGVRLSAHVYRKTFSLSHTEPLVCIFAYIICILALIPGSETSVERIYDFLLTYSYIAYPLLPLLLIIFCSVFRRRRRYQP